MLESPSLLKTGFLHCQNPQSAFYLNLHLAFCPIFVWVNADIVCPAFEISCIENSIMVTLNQHTKFKDLAALLDWVSVCVCRTCILLVSVCVKTNNSTQSFSLKLVDAGFLSLFLSLYFVTHAGFFLPCFFSILTR